MSKLRTLIYIYSETALAMFLAFCGLIEFACALVIDQSFQLLAIGAGSVFMLTAATLCLVVYRKAKANNHI
jgi:hypothetical protein